MQQQSEDCQTDCLAYDEGLQKCIDDVNRFANRQDEAQESYEMLLWWKFMCRRMNVQWIATDNEDQIRKAAPQKHTSIAYLQDKFGKPLPKLTDCSESSKSNYSESSSSDDDDLPQIVPLLETVVVKRQRITKLS